MSSPPRDALPQAGLKQTRILDNGVFNLADGGILGGIFGFGEDSDLREGHLERLQRPLHALTELQLSRDRPLDALTIQTAVQWLTDTIPMILSDRICIPPPEDRRIFGCSDEDFAFALDEFAAEFDNMGNLRNDWLRPFFKPLMKSDYFMWTVDGKKVGEDANPHWVTIIAHLTKQQELGGYGDEEFGGDFFDLIDTWTVVDPDNSDAGREREFRISSRLREIMLQGQIEIMDDSFSRLWVHPMNPGVYTIMESFSSGLRSWFIIKTMIGRIVEAATRGIDYNPAHFWSATDGWLNLDVVRWEMTAAVAGVLNARCGHRFRMALHPVNATKKDGRNYPSNAIRPADDSLGGFRPDVNDGYLAHRSDMNPLRRIVAERHGVFDNGGYEESDEDDDSDDSDGGDGGDGGDPIAHEEGVDPDRVQD
ncbi:hypothetical protein F5B20DRAFT_578764 [Whalleya microplaca]|nr:hypothetical protein F5B20DRAFT_578764 [Whalleya microplaca]